MFLDSIDSSKSIHIFFLLEVSEPVYLSIRKPGVNFTKPFPYL